MQKAFTLVEMIVVCAIVGSLLVLAMTNLLSGQRKSQLDSTMSTMISDLREQRIKAMTGDTDGTGTALAYGVYFGNNYYTLFRGNSYQATSAANFVINLDPTLTLSGVSWPGLQVVFSSGSGEVSGWSSGSASINLVDVDQGATKVIMINKYGTPIWTD